MNAEFYVPSLTWLTRDDDLKRAAAVPDRPLEADPALSQTGSPVWGAKQAPPTPRADHVGVAAGVDLTQ
jgi:hypothetical protein